MVVTKANSMNGLFIEGRASLAGNWMGGPSKETGQHKPDIFVGEDLKL